MHIVFFHHYAGSPHHGMAYRVYYLAQEFIKKGHTVTIVASSESHIRTHNPEVTQLFTNENIDGIEYIWVKTRKYGGNGLKRVLNMIDFLRGLYKLIPTLKKHKIDAVIAASTYPLDNFPAHKLAKLTKAKHIYEVRDLWPLSPLQLGGYSKYHPFIVVMQIAENFAYKHADKVISVLACAESYMQEHGLAKGKFSYVPNGIYLPEISNKQPLTNEAINLLPKDKFILGYCGTFGLANTLNKVVEVARDLEKNYPDLLFVLVGKGPEKQNILNLINEYNLQNIKVLDSIPKAQVQSYLQICDVLLLLLWTDSDLYKYGISPNKIFDYLYAGKPIIQSVKAGNDLMKESGGGITCDTTLEAIKQAIIQMYTMPKEQREQMGKSGHEFVIKNHSYDVLAIKFLEALC